MYIRSGRDGEVVRVLRPSSGQVAGHYGMALAGLEDVDGDGLGDVVVGAPGETPTPRLPSAGAAYIASGGTGENLFRLQSPSVQFAGNFGAAVAGVPDVDGDGAWDVVIGAYYEFGSGRAYVFSGATGELLHTLVSPNEYLQGGSFGWSVAGVPDVDGDGRGDVLVGASGELSGPNWPMDRGRAYLFSGATGAVIHTLLSPDPHPGTFGVTVSGVPDLNGDGLTDLAVSAPSEPHEGLHAEEGRVHLYSGADGSYLRTLTAPHHVMHTTFGGRMRGVPDLDGDGFGDIVASGGYEFPMNGFPMQAGSIYLVSGATGTVIRRLISPNPTFDGFFGATLTGVPDVTGDGLAEVVVGAPGEPRPGGIPGQQGRAYLIRSCRADVDGSYRVQSADFLLFLGWFFEADPRAEFDHDGAVGSGDFFAFLTAFFEGCP